MADNYTPYNHISVVTAHAASVPIVHIAGKIDPFTCDWIAEDGSPMDFNDCLQ